MSDTMQVTPEDRERLAKGKFKEWFNECLEEVIDDRIKKAVGPTAKAAQQGNDGGGRNNEGQQQQQQDPAPRRSLLETCLSQTFGF